MDLPPTALADAPGWLELLAPLYAPLATLVIGVLSVVGVIYGHHVLKDKAAAEDKLAREKLAAERAALDQERQNAVAAAREKLIEELRSDRAHLDQQLAAQRREHNDQIDKLNNRVTGFYADKHASRRHIAQLEKHIWDGKAPPPPSPPDGYVP
ncbi:hypothetical protein [Zhihengliuella halotolerans]|uniref:Uncharacterized protein n=1 Tax=Zhihengliuella halotolerans TaxID=370736 RepID=A0A4Q8AC14_9MICC|nr:hypothetical protein [Zhihengliuella halotolerans]RZU61730.1 hypothetical protein EV380_1308 [Zhihengliuella halotolerans]